MTRTAIVTGGSRGLGRALVRALAERGWHVVTDGRDAAALDAAVGELGVVAVPGDVTDPAHRRRARRRRRPAPIDLLVNNAGGLGPSPLPGLAEYPLDALADLFAVNVVAPLGLIQEALPHLADGRRRSSTSRPTRRSRRTRAGAATAPPRRRSTTSAGCSPPSSPTLRVLTIDPGDMRTQMHQDAFPGEDISDRPLPEASVPGILALIEGDRPSGRYRGVARWRRDRHDRRSTRRSSSRPSWRRPSRRRSRSAGATPCACWSRSASEPPRPSIARDLADVARRGRPRRRQHVGDDPGGDRRHDARRPGRRRPPLDRAADRPAPRRGPPPGGRRHDGARPRRPRRRRRSRLAGGGQRAAARTDAAVGPAVGRHARRCRRRCSSTSTAAGRPIRYRLRARLVAARRLHQRLRPRAGLGRDAVGRAGR